MTENNETLETKETKNNLHFLFPTVLLSSNIERDIWPEEIECVEKYKKNIFRNAGNWGSDSTDVLNDPEFEDIKNFIDLKLKDYFYDIMKAPKHLELYVTQSWLNFTEPGEFHHKHIHPNSLVSGVFYLQTEISDKITFFKYFDDTSMIQFDPTEYAYTNSASWWLEAEQGNLFIFPSNTYHMVENTVSKKTRVSLAFNTFIRGEVGQRMNYTKLNLK